MSWFQTEGTRTNFQGFVWDAIKLWFLISPSGIGIQSYFFGMRASLRVLYKNMTSYLIISKKYFCDGITSILYTIQGCCLTGARAPGAPKLCGRLKFSSRSPSGRINMEFTFPSNLSDDFHLLKKSIKKSFTQ